MGGAHSHRADRHPPHSHGHSHGGGDDGFEVDRVPRTVLLATLVLAAVATLIGVGLLWPDGDRAEQLRDEVSFAAPGVTFPTADVVRVEERCPDLAPAEGCGQIEISYDGSNRRVGVPPDVLEAGLEAGDQVRLIVTPGADGAEATVSYFGIERSTPVWILVGLFVIVVLLVARWRGLFALIGLGFAGLVLLEFVLPALLVGESAAVVGLVGSTAIMYVVLYTTHGFSIRTSAALAGTLVGVLLTATLGWVSVRATNLTGVADEGSNVLTGFVGDLNMQGLMTCAILIAGLGVLNDVTITQASAVWELRAAAPGLSRTRIFASAMRIGRDHIASSIYTIVFAYAGTALMILMVLELYGLPIRQLLATEEIAQEVVRTLATSIGLVLAVPVTTAIAAVTVPGARSA